MDFDSLFAKMSNPMTTEEAIALSKSNWWESVGMAKAAYLQLHQSKLCMPFGKFHEAVEFLLARPVFSHEFAYADKLREEVYSGKSPTFQEIVSLIPEEKRIVVEVSDRTPTPYTPSEKSLLGCKVQAIVDIKYTSIVTILKGAMGKIIDFGRQSGDPLIRWENGHEGFAVDKEHIKVIDRP